MSIAFSFANMFANAIGFTNGIENDALNRCAERFTAIHRNIALRYENGSLPFYDLPFDYKVIDSVVDYSRDAKQRFENYVHLGIGGSALGPVALHTALNHPQHNLLDKEHRNGCRFFCPDNVDPDLMASVLDVIEPENTLFNVVSKSGGTAETAAQFLVIVNFLKENLGDNWRDHLILTTDPEKGFLRNYADENSIRTFPIDPGVGGRFTVLSPVGLLPAAITGIDIKRLCQGAAAVKEICMSSDFRKNPAAMFAALLHLSQVERAKPMHVMFAYSNRLLLIADWFRQLWAESLGKRYSLDKEEVFTGPTPIKAIGATDQHSQVQLYVEGPADKVVIFVGTGQFEREVLIPGLGKEAPETLYLEGSDFATLLNNERRATAFALTQAGRPNMTIEVEKIDPEHVGALLYILEAATLYAGGFYNVNPLDQPGVEAGKLAAYALMGREGYDKQREEILRLSGDADEMVIEV